MKKNSPFVIVSLTVILVTLGCNFSLLNPNPTPFFPTPNMTMTALFTVDETKPTDNPDFTIKTLPPPLPTVENTVVQPSATTQPMPSNTATQVAATQVINTPAPTNTEVPIRSGTWVYAKYMKNPPKFDSLWDEWESTKYPATFVVFGKDQWENAEDLEGSFAVSWNEVYLFVAVKVYDDVYVQNATGAEIFKGDSIELLIDTDLYGDASTQSLNADDFQIGISPGRGDINGEKEVYLWFPKDKEGKVQDTIVSSSRDSGITRVEFAIPWKAIGHTPASGQQLGFAFSISDNDDTSKNVQQTMVSNIYPRRLTDPTSWTVLTLTN